MLCDNARNKSKNNNNNSKDPDTKKRSLASSDPVTMPTWMGYAWSKSPFPEDLSATIYSDNGYRLPATLWRCELKQHAEDDNIVCNEIWKLEEELLE